MVLTLAQAREFAQSIIALSAIERIRHVKTPEGAKFFDLPIGSLIPPGKLHPKLRSIAALNNLPIGTRIRLSKKYQGKETFIYFTKSSNTHWKSSVSGTQVETPTGAFSPGLVTGRITLDFIPGELNDTTHKNPIVKKLTVTDLMNAPVGAKIDVVENGVKSSWSKDINKNWATIDKPGSLHSVSFKHLLDEGTVSFVTSGQMKPLEAGSLKKLGEVLEIAKKDMSAKKFEVLADPGASGDGYHSPGLWGKYGAAGVLIRNVDEYGNEKFLLVERGAGVSSNVGKWQLPGGALDSKESPYQGVARETVEELKAPQEFLAGLVPVNENVYEKNGWKYTNITADSAITFTPVVDGVETSAAGWFTPDEIKELPLHPALVKNMDILIKSFPKPIVKNWEDALIDIPKIQNDIKNIQALLKPVSETQVPVIQKHYSVPDLIAMPVGTTIKGTPDGEKHYTLIKNFVGMWAVSATPIDHMHGQNAKSAWVWSLLGNTQFGDWEVRKPAPEKPKLLVMSVKELDLAGVGTKIIDGDGVIYEKKSDKKWYEGGQVYQTWNFEFEIAGEKLSFVTEDSLALPSIGGHFTSLEQFNSLPIGAVVGWTPVPDYTWEKTSNDKFGWTVLPSGETGAAATPTEGNLSKTFLVSLPTISEKKSASKLYDEPGYLEGLPDGTVLVQEFVKGPHVGDKVHWLKKDGKWWKLDKEGKIFGPSDGLASSVLAQPNLVIVDMFTQDIKKDELKFEGFVKSKEQLDAAPVGTVVKLLNDSYTKLDNGSWLSKNDGQEWLNEPGEWWTQYHFDEQKMSFVSVGDPKLKFEGFVKSKEQLDAAPIGTVIKVYGDKYTKLENGKWQNSTGAWNNVEGEFWHQSYFAARNIEFVTPGKKDSSGIPDKVQKEFDPGTPLALEPDFYNLPLGSQLVWYQGNVPVIYTNVQGNNYWTDHNGDNLYLPTEIELGYVYPLGGKVNKGTEKKFTTLNGTSFVVPSSAQVYDNTYSGKKMVRFDNGFWAQYDSQAQAVLPSNFATMEKSVADGSFKLTVGVQEIGNSISVDVSGKIFSVPEGSSVYVSTWEGLTGFKYAMYPDGSWHQFSETDGDSALNASGARSIAKELIANKEIVLDPTVVGNTEPNLSIQSPVVVSTTSTIKEQFSYDNLQTLPAGTTVKTDKWGGVSFTKAAGDKGWINNQSTSLEFITTEYLLSNYVNDNNQLNSFNYYIIPTKVQESTLPKTIEIGGITLTKQQAEEALAALKEKDWAFFAALPKESPLSDMASDITTAAYKLGLPESNSKLVNAFVQKKLSEFLGTQEIVPGPEKKVVSHSSGLKPGKYSTKATSNASMVILENGSAFYVDKTGTASPLTPKAVQAKIKAGLIFWHGPGSAKLPGAAQAVLEGPVVFKAGQGTKTYEAPVGSKVYHVATKNSETATSKYVLKPDGVWAIATESTMHDQPVDVGANLAIKVKEGKLVLDKNAGPKKTILKNPAGLDGTYPFEAPPNINANGSNALTAEMVKLVDGSGYKGIAGLNRTGMGLDDKRLWLKHWYNGSWDAAYNIELAAAGKVDKDAQVKSEEELTNAPVGAKLRLYYNKTGYHTFTKYENNTWSTYETAYGNSSYYMWTYYEKGDLVWPDKIHHAKAVQHPGSPDNPINANGFKKINFGPAVTGEIVAGGEVTGPALESYTTQYTGDTYYLNTDAVNVFMLAAGMQNAHGLTATQKKTWVQKHIQGQKLPVDELSMLAKTNVQNGKFYSAELSAPKPVMKTGQTIDVSGVVKEFNVGSSHAVNLSPAQTNEYVRQLFTSKAAAVVANQELDVKQAIVQLHWLTTMSTLPKNAYKSKEQATVEFNALKASIELQVASKNVDSHGNIKDFTLALPPVNKVTAWSKAPNKGNFKGAFEKYWVLDDTQTEFFFKPAKEPWRAEIANAAHKASKLFGYDPTWSDVITVDGVYGQVQNKVQDLGDISGTKPEDLTETEFLDIMKEHVFDWVTGQDDSHWEQFMKKPDGHLRHIDMDRAWVFSTDSRPMKLSLDGPWKGSYVVETPYYKDVYGAIVAGRINEDWVRKAYKSTIQKAKFVSKVSDDNYREILESGPLHNPNLNETQKAEFVAAALARKHAAASDFEIFWDSVFAKSGIAKPEPSMLTEQPGLFTGFTGELLDSVKKARNYGHATFFAGENLEDGHFILWEEKGKGEKIHRASGTIVEPSDVAKIPVGTVIKANSTGTEYTKTASGSWKNSDDSEMLKDYHIDNVIDNVGATYINDTTFALTGAVPDTLMGQAQLRKSADQKMVAWLNANYTGPGIGSSVEDLSLSGLQNQKTYATSIKAGHRTVEYHTKENDFKYNQSKIDEMASVKSQIQHELDSGSYVTLYPEQPKKTAAHKEMLEHYLAIINNVEQSITDKTAPLGFVFYKYKSQNETEIKLKPAYNISKRYSKLHIAELDADTNNLYATDAESSDGQSGHEYVIELQDGTTLYYRPWEATNMSQKGLLKFRKVGYDDNIEHANSALEFLRNDVGISLDESTDEDQELLYWRMLYGTLMDRSDSLTSPQNNVVNTVKANDPRKASDKEIELDLWRQAWSQLAGPEMVNKWVETQGYMPRFERSSVQDHENVHGRPYWLRFDVDINEMRLKNEFLARSVYGMGGGSYSGDYGNPASLDAALLTVVKSGASIPGEERARVVGHWIEGGGSPSGDQEKGSSMFNMVRQNIEHSSYHIYYDPALMARISTYSYSEDLWGNISYKKSKAYWNMKNQTKHTGEGNEAPVKYALNILDHAALVVFDSEKIRQEALKFYSGLGITHIAGAPIEDVFVINANRAAGLKKAHAHMKARVLAGADYVPPKSVYVPDVPAPTITAASAKKISSYVDLNNAAVGTKIQEIGNSSNVLTKSDATDSAENSYWEADSGTYSSDELIPYGETSVYEFVPSETSAFIGKKPTSYEELNSMPVGTKLAYEHDPSVWWVKEEGNTWLGSGAGSNNNVEEVYYKEYTYVHIPVPKIEPTSVKLGNNPVSVAELDAMPVGTVIKGSGGATWTKEESGTWDGSIAGPGSPSTSISLGLYKYSYIPGSVADNPLIGKVPVSVEQLQSAPAGTVLASATSATWTKENDETWTGNNAGPGHSSETVFNMLYGGYKYKTIPAPDDGVFGQKTGLVKSNDELLAAPVGTKIKKTYASGHTQIFIKQVNGKWLKESTGDEFDSVSPAFDVPIVKLEWATDIVKKTGVVASLEDLQNAPVGTKILRTYKAGTTALFTKTNSGQWKKDSEPDVQLASSFIFVQSVKLEWA